MNIESKLEEVFRQTFAQPKLKMRRDLSPRNLSGWDSLAHVRLILAVEKAFGLKVASADLSRLRNAGDFLDFLADRI